MLASCGSDATTPKAENSQCAYPKYGAASRKVDPPPGNPDKDAPTEVTISTNQGDIKVSLDADQAPCAVNSFLSLARQGFYDNTTCHRLTTQGFLFLLQCGDPTGTGQGGPGYTYADELVDNDPRLQPCQPDGAGGQYCTYTKGTVAMANGNPQRPDTNGSQFFLLYDDSLLPPLYPVLGHMSAAGLKHVQDVAKGGTVPGTEQPRTSVTISSVK